MLQIGRDQCVTKLVEHRHLIRQLLEALPERSVWVLTTYYGLDGGGCSTDKEIAEELNISVVRAQQIRQKSLRLMRDRYASLQNGPKIKWRYPSPK